MVGVCRLTVIGGVAAVASVGRVVVIAIVTSSAIIRDASVGPVQRIIIVVNREGGRLPARRCCVTHGTIRRYVQCRVLRVGALVIIGRMTTIAGIRGIVVIAVVTGVAIIRNRNMCSCKRINDIVIESRRHPGCFVVASRTVGGELRCRVVGIRGIVIIGGVAAVAGVGRVVIIPVVAGGAVIRNGGVRAVQGIEIVVDRERCRLPAR